MKLKYIISAILVFALLTGAAGCGFIRPNTPVTPVTTTAPQASYVYSDETTEPVTQDPDADPVLPPLEFDPEKAEYLGTIESGIYGNIKIYYQDLRLVIYDSYGKQIFTLYANGYEPFYNNSPVELFGDDVNFDGYTDFYLLYSEANLNSYYFFWIWNMQERTFKYYLPLSSVPSPEIDAERKRIVSSDYTDFDTLVTTEYVWQNNNIMPVAHGEATVDHSGESTLPDGPEEADTSMSILDGHILSTVTMRLNETTRSDWLCRIEDESVVRLYTNTVDNNDHTHRFIFRGVKPGTTTVLLRYAQYWDSDYIAQRILNITVQRDYTLKIVLVE